MKTCQDSDLFDHKNQVDTLGASLITPKFHTI